MRTASLMTWVLVALAAAPALADMPPPSTYVETCTIAKQVTTTSECLQCSAYYGDPTRCTNLLAPYCYRSLCKTWGASSWGEVLCRTKAADAPVVPSDVIAILGSPTTAFTAPARADGGAMPGSCAPFTPPTGTATTTATTSKTDTASIIATVTVTETAVVTQSATSTLSNTQNATLVHTSTGTSTGSSAGKTSDDSSGCSVTAGKSAVRALGPLSVVLAGLALLVLRRRSRR